MIPRTYECSSARYLAAQRARGSCCTYPQALAWFHIMRKSATRFFTDLGLLGHAKLSSTQIYTQVSIRMLKQVHSMTHPAQLRKPAAETSDGNHDQQKTTLLAMLQAESEEENE